VTPSSPPNRVSAAPSDDLSSLAYRLAFAALPVVLILFHWPWVVSDRPPNGSDTLVFLPLAEE